MSSKNGWITGKLEDLVVLQRGFDITKSQQESGDVPVVTSSGINSYHSESKVEGPGVITGRSGSLGKVFFVDEPYWPHNTTLWSKDFKGNNPRFIYYFLRYLQLKRYDSGSSEPTLNRNHIHRLEITYPEVTIQNRISGILEVYDDLIENNSKRIQLLEQAAIALYKEWFVHLRFPGHEQVTISNGLPEGWGTKKFGEICDAIGGGTPSTSRADYWEGGTIPWYSPTDITRNTCLALLDSERKITQTGMRKSSAKMLPAGTILMTSRASVGYFGIIEAPSCTNQGFINIIPNDPNYRLYLLYNLMNRVEQIRLLAGGATYTEIGKKSFNSLELSIPPSSISTMFEKQVTSLLDQVRTLHRMNNAVEKAVDILMPRLMRGGVNL